METDKLLKLASERFIDILEPVDEIEIRVAPDNRIWINVDGVCLFRSKEAKTVIVNDCLNTERMDDEE